MHHIPRVHPTYAELLADPDVEVLDVAVPPDAQPALIREAVRHNDHIRGILAQKPLALSVREARECVEACASAGVVLAVNQNMRYDQSVRAMKDLYIAAGWATRCWRRSRCGRSRTGCRGARRCRRCPRS